MFGGRLDRLVDLGNVDLAVRALQLTQNADEGLERVRSDAPVRAGVQVSLEGANGNFGVAQASERRIDRWNATRVVRCIANQRGIGPGSLGLRAQQIEDNPPAALFLALEHEADVERRPPRGVEYRLVGLEQAIHLALVVGSATGIELPVPYGRLEGRADPFVQRVWRLNIVVAVDEQGRPPGHLWALRPDHRVTVTLDDLDRRAAQTGQLVTQPLRCTPAIGGVGGESTHTRNTQETR